MSHFVLYILLPCSELQALINNINRKKNFDRGLLGSRRLPLHLLASFPMDKDIYMNINYFLLKPAVRKKSEFGNHLGILDESFFRKILSAPSRFSYTCMYMQQNCIHKLQILSSDVLCHSTVARESV